MGQKIQNRCSDKDIERLARLNVEVGGFLERTFLMLDAGEFGRSVAAAKQLQKHFTAEIEANLLSAYGD